MLLRGESCYAAHWQILAVKPGYLTRLEAAYTLCIWFSSIMASPMLVKLQNAIREHRPLAEIERLVLSNPSALERTDLPMLFWAVWYQASFEIIEFLLDHVSRSCRKYDGGGHQNNWSADEALRVIQLLLKANPEGSLTSDQKRDMDHLDAQKMCQVFYAFAVAVSFI